MGSALQHENDRRMQVANQRGEIGALRTRAELIEDELFATLTQQVSELELAIGNLRGVLAAMADARDVRRKP